MPESGRCPNKVVHPHILLAAKQLFYSQANNDPTLCQTMTGPKVNCAPQVNIQSSPSGWQRRNGPAYEKSTPPKVNMRTFWRTPACGTAARSRGAGGSRLPGENDFTLRSDFTLLRVTLHSEVTLHSPRVTLHCPRCVFPWNTAEFVSLYVICQLLVVVCRKVEYDPFVKGQLALRNYLWGRMWYKVPEKLTPNKHS